MKLLPLQKKSWEKPVLISYGNVIEITCDKPERPVPPGKFPNSYDGNGHFPKSELS